MLAPQLLVLLLSTLFLLIGIIGVIGTLRRWKWLVDPAVDEAKYNPLSMVNKHFGKRVVLIMVWYIIIMHFSFGIIGYYLLVLNIFDSPPLRHESRVIQKADETSGE